VAAIALVEQDSSDAGLNIRPEQVAALHADHNGDFAVVGHLGRAGERPHEPLVTVIA
jgi:hypothetical protein